MSFSVSCCSCLGFFSLLGAIFYLTCAAMVYNKNKVFIEHKIGLDIFTVSDD